MRLTEEMLEKIDTHYSTDRREVTGYKIGLGLYVNNSIVGNHVAICINETEICELAELDQLIEELICLEGIIKENTGLY